MYQRNVLDIDEKVFFNMLHSAISEGLNLAVEVQYSTKDTVELLLQQAFRVAKSIALDNNIFADAVTEELITKAAREGQCLIEQHLKQEQR